MHNCLNLVTLVYICLHLFKFVYICLYLFTFVYICLHLFKFVYICLHLFIFVYTCLHLFILFKFVYICLHCLNLFTLVYIYLHLFIFVLTCLYLFTHVCVCLHSFILQKMLNKYSASVKTRKFLSSDNVTRCTVIEVYRGFRGTCRFKENVNMSLPNYTASHPRKQGCSHFPPSWPYMSAVGTYLDLLRSPFDFLRSKSLVVQGTCRLGA
jgi:hypothetical protein